MLFKYYHVGGDKKPFWVLSGCILILEFFYIANLCKVQGQLDKVQFYCQTPVLGLGLGDDFTFAGDNHNDKNHKNGKNDKNDNNPHLNFVKGTVLGDTEQGVGITDKG